MVNKFANTKQSDDNEKREICKHTISKLLITPLLSVITNQILFFYDKSTIISQEKVAEST